MHLHLWHIFYIYGMAVKVSFSVGLKVKIAII